jgi:hypothetical protein
MTKGRGAVPLTEAIGMAEATQQLERTVVDKTGLKGTYDEIEEPALSHNGRDLQGGF